MISRTATPTGAVSIRFQYRSGPAGISSNASCNAATLQVLLGTFRRPRRRKRRGGLSAPVGSKGAEGPSENAIRLVRERPYREAHTRRIAALGPDGEA
jgi:hypothetical protein